MKKNLVRSKILSVMLATTVTVTSFQMMPSMKVCAATSYGSDFDNKYAYDGELGCIYSKESTTFKVWAPTASKVVLVRYKEGDGNNKIEELPMTGGTQSDKGVWSCTVQGDIVNTYYTYKITTPEYGESEACDIYANSVGVNGNRAMVVDMTGEDTIPSKARGDETDWDTNYKRTKMNLSDMVTWEVHVRDFSYSDSSGVKDEYQGKYLAFTQQGTTLNDEGNIKTGIDYLKELGVTHVQILPMFDYGSVDETNSDSDAAYNWGYDPKNYNAPEGSYSTNPYDGSVRVKELREMIQALHDAGIKVIMDVVYNHTYMKGSHEEAWFEETVPKYYYRTTNTSSDGTYTNGSGCGNETRSESAMFRKFMIDSVVHWAEDYNLDGFRFDLMGLHDTETMNQIRSTLDEKFGEGTILLYGEGWTGGTSGINATPAMKENVRSLNNIGYFNDQIRDAVKGEANHDGVGSIGLAQQHYKEGRLLNTDDGEKKWPNNVYGGIKASVGKSSGQYWMWRAYWADNSNKVVSYASCHDNLSLWDKLVETGDKTGDYNSTNDNYIRMNRLVGGYILTSHGGSFMQAGEEFARTKNGDENSYSSLSSVNAIDWNRVKAYSSIQSYYQGMIAIRKAFSGFRNEFTDSGNNDKPNGNNITWIETDSDETNVNSIAYYLSNSIQGEWDEVAVLINNTIVSRTYNLTDSDSWVMVSNGEKADIKGVETINSSSVTVPAKSVAVAVPKDTYDANPDVGKKNTAPVISTDNTKISAKTGEKVEFTVSATDADGDAVTLLAAKLPENANFDAATGKFTWDNVTEGTTTVTFTATDGTDTTSLVVTITGASVTSALNILLADIDAAKLTQENTGCTDELWASFNTEIANAQAIAEKTDATEAECTAAVTSLNIAFITVKNTKIAKDALDETKAKAETKIAAAKADSENYDAEALEDAEAVLETAKALTKATPDDFADMNEDVEDTLIALVSLKASPTVHVSTTWTTPYIYIWTGTGETAVEYAGKWPGTALTDKDADGNYVLELEENISYNIIINNGKTSKQQTADLAGLSGDIYITVGATATSTDDNENAIYPATTDCKEIGGGTTIKVDTTKLAARIATEKEKKSEDYESTGFQALQDAIAASEAVVADTATTQVKVNQQYRALKAASKALVFVGVATPTPPVTEVPTPIVTVEPIETVEPGTDVTGTPESAAPTAATTIDPNVTSTPNVTNDPSDPNVTNNPSITDDPNNNITDPTPTVAPPSANVTNTPNITDIPPIITDVPNETTVPNPTATIIPTSTVKPTVTPEPVLAVSSLKVLAPQKKGVGNKYTFYATAKNGEEAYKYKFILNEGMSGKKTLKSYSKKSSVTWTPKKAGTYKITVYVKDATGEVTSKEIFFKVAKKQLSVKTFKFTSKTLKVNKSLKGAVTTANVKGTAYYKFVIKNSKNKIVKTRKYTKKRTFAWKPTAKGKYKVIIYIKDGRNAYIRTTNTVTIK